MIKAMHNIKLIEKSSSQELMDLLGLEENLAGIAEASGV